MAMFEVCATNMKTGKTVVLGYSDDPDGKVIIAQNRHNDDLRNFHTRGLAHDTIELMLSPKRRKPK